MGFFRSRSISYSLFLHFTLFALWAFFYAQNLSAPRATRTTTYIEVEPLPVSTFKDEKTKQVVQTETGQLTKEAAKNANLGERTQIVEKERVATSKLDQTPTAARRQAKPKSQDRASTFQKTGVLSNLGVALPKPGLKPEDEIQRVAEVEGSLDAQVKGEYVKGYKTGEQTMLNTREYVFFGYFQRIRTSLDRAWDKSLRAQLMKYFYKGRQLASEMDYTTQLLVTLNNDGQVIQVQVIGQSGTRDLDDAAVKAFNQAGPFPNPPQGLVDTRGTIQVRWDFVLRT